MRVRFRRTLSGRLADGPLCDLGDGARGCCSPVFRFKRRRSIVGHSATAPFAMVTKLPINVSAYWARLRTPCGKAVFLRGYSKDVTLLSLSSEARRGKACDELFAAGIKISASVVRSILWETGNIMALMSDGTRERFDVIYPVLGCQVRSETRDSPRRASQRSRLS